MSTLNAPMVAGLAAVAAGSLAYVFVMPWLSGERQADKRIKALGTSHAAVERGGNNRREQVAKSLKELEAKADSTKVSLELRLTRAGLTWSRKFYFVVSAVLAVAFCLGLLVLSGNPVVALGGLFAGGLGAPRWLLSFLQKRRVKTFTLELPNAIDIVVRGIRSGIPLADCLRTIAREAEEPLRSEFKAVVDAQSLGLPMNEAILRMYERVPVSDVNFFAIVIGIQEKSGGNLSEALMNLSRVLRERKKMASKVQAMSMEAKASGVIIAAMPCVVALLTYFSSPDYVSLLWTTSMGKVALAGSAIWMSIGIFTMKKMISFEV